MVMKKKVAISEFKAKCLALLEEVNKTKQPLLVTRFGKPVAQVSPPAPEEEARAGWFGSMVGKGEILGDIVAPVVDPDDWEVLRD